jgi:hypothetical protein
VKGYRNQLQGEDMPALIDDDTAAVQNEKFEAAWAIESEQDE